MQCVKPPSPAPTFSAVPTSKPTTASPTATFKPSFSPTTSAPTTSSPTLSPTVTADVCFVLEMSDSYGDGWNGADWTWTDSDDGSVIKSGTLDDGSEGVADLCVWWNTTLCYGFEVGSGSWDTEISWVIKHPATGEQKASGGASSTAEICGFLSPKPSSSPTSTPVPSPLSAAPTTSSPTTGCAMTCYTQSCDYWDGAYGSIEGQCDYYGNLLEDYYGCNCAGCQCNNLPPTLHPTFSKMPTPAVDSMLTLTMTDTYGDGWNGAYYTWQQTDGVTPADIGTLSGGSEGTAQLNVYDESECYTMTVGTGTYDYEIEWTIVDKVGRGENGRWGRRGRWG